MPYDVLFILLNLFVSIADFSPTTENECIENANNRDDIESARVRTALRHRIACAHKVWSRSNAGKMNLHFIMRPLSARFDEDSGTLDVLSWVVIYGMEDRLTWNMTQFPTYSTTFTHPDVLFLSVGTDDIHELAASNVWCHIDCEGAMSCGDRMRHNIRCQSDLTLWPYDRHTCTIIITSWFYTAESLNLSDKYSPIHMLDLNPDDKWNISVSRINYEQRKFKFHDNVIYPQISIEFTLDRHHSLLRRRFVTLALIMMIMILTALWLDPESYERLAVASLNIVIHMMCIQDIHWVLPRYGITVPNIMIFYINSFVLAIVAIPLTFFLRKIKDTKNSVPNWISSNIERLLRSKAGHFLLLIMLDPKSMSEIETRADDNNGLLSSERKEFTWKYMAIFFSWIFFFSFFSAYILMYIILIPNSASKPPAMSIPPRFP